MQQNEGDNIQDESEAVLMFKNEMEGGYHGSLAPFNLDGDVS
jgi:hypothetical protein